MKAISLWQPWASAMAVGLKTVETRHWPTAYRGELAIHAAKKKPGEHISGDVGRLLYGHRNRFPGFHGNIADFFINLPYGQIVCVVTVVDCVPTTSVNGDITHEEWTLGNYTQGRYAWITKHYKRLEYPVPCVGRQSFFTIPENIEQQVRNQVAPASSFTRNEN